MSPLPPIEGEVLLRAGVKNINTSERHTRNKGERNGIGKMIRINNHQNKNKHVLSFHVTGTAPSALCFNYLNPPKQSKEIDSIIMSIWQERKLSTENRPCSRSNLLESDQEPALTPVQPGAPGGVGTKRHWRGLDLSYSAPGGCPAEIHARW